MTVILFPKLESWNDSSKVATIAASVDKERVLCRISLTILRNKFGALEDHPMRSISQHRLVIQDAARKLIEKEAFEDDGSIMIRSVDI